MNATAYQRCTTPGTDECRARSITHRRITRQCLNCAQPFHADRTQQHTNICPNCSSSARRAAAGTVTSAPAVKVIASAYRAFADYIGDRRQRGVPSDGLPISRTVLEESTMPAPGQPAPRGSYRGPSRKRLAFEENLEFLLSTGTPFVDIMARLDIVHFPNLERRLERAGRADLLAQLKETPPASRALPSRPTPADRQGAANDRLFQHLMVKARIEADRARRGIPATGERSIRIVHTNRSVPVLQEVA